MKRFLIMCLVVFLAVSCRVYRGDDRADNYILEEISGNLFDNYVSSPVIFVDWMQDFDGYLFGENASYNGFTGGNVVQTGENAYHIDGFGLVDTGGKSLDEPGAVWSLTAESYARWTGSSSLQCFGTENDEPPKMHGNFQSLRSRAVLTLPSRNMTMKSATAHMRRGETEVLMTGIIPLSSV